MDFLGNQYYNLKTAIIKSERRILKELGFCVHVKHPNKIIITYLQMLEHEKNVSLARKAWNYMNDSLRTDVFVRFPPEIIACACIFLAARTLKINLPLRPPWWELFDASYDDIEDIALSILRLYAKPRREIKKLESAVNKIKKAIQEKHAAKEAAAKEGTNGSFTPSHVPEATQPAIAAINNNNSSKPTSRTNSPVTKVQEKLQEKRQLLSSVVTTQKNNSDHRKREGDRHRKSESEESSEYSSDSGAELPSKKYLQQQKQYEKKKRHSSSTDSDNDTRKIPSKVRRSVSPKDSRKKSRDRRDRPRDKESNGQLYKNNSYSKEKRRSRSPVKRGRSASPTRKEKHSRDKNHSRDRIRSKDKYDKYVSKIRR